MRLGWIILLLAVAVGGASIAVGWRQGTSPTGDARPLPRQVPPQVDTTPEGPAATADRTASPTGISFHIADAGIDFRYFNSDDPATPGARMFEFTGGGVGAFDYDGDGRVDLFLTQGCRWPPREHQREHLDTLYRNVGERFRDVTAAADIVEPGFSQGLAVGDVDGDGFDDLYVANIGRNRLFLNNGDGTFHDVTATALPAGGPQDDAWTTSAAVADLNADGLPEIFDVNYVEGHDVFERICDHDGIRRVCSPTMFEGQPDRLLLNRGNGVFTDVSPIAGIDAPDGTGLGLVVADFDGEGRLSVLVGNDARNNHFFHNETAAPGDVPHFVEQAERNGTAYDRDGRAQACMGIAAGDADGDGRLDLFVTNYVEESNTLYANDGDGQFHDASRDAGLTQPSLRLLGFGTQFLDADLDGWEDLVVVNGHVDDFTPRGYDYAMRPQFFQNRGGTFVERTAADAGPFFDEKRLGRGLARLDWNGDGRDDFAVSYLDGPALLLTNETAPAGRSFRVKLVATQSARDAIGATIVVETGTRRLVRWATAGDGYQTANERTFTIGLGTAGVADRVTIRWPSGAVSKFESIATDGLWLAIEGRDKLLRLADTATRRKS